MDNVPYWKTSFIKKLESGNITIEGFEEKLKLRSLEMLTHGEMENPNFSLTQECSKRPCLFSALDLCIYRVDGGT